MITEETKNKIIALAAAIRPNAKIYLFGSQARGTASQSSDIDIALDEGQRISRFDIAEIKEIIEASRIAKRVDVVDLYSVPEGMREEIIKEKIVWKN